MTMTMTMTMTMSMGMGMGMGMGMRRFTRLTNGFSKKVKNLEHAGSLHFMHYNFARIDKTLRVTPAIAASISDHVWKSQN